MGKNRKIALILTVLFLIQTIVFTPKVFASAEQDWIKLVTSQGYLPKNRNGMSLNYSTYKRYAKIVYGNPFGDYKSGEYRYLGQNDIGREVTNTKFPNDVTSSGPPETWNFTDVSGAKGSWGSVTNTNLEAYMKAVRLVGNGAKTLTINGHVGAESKALVQTVPSLFSEGSVRLEHNEGGGTLYGTFTIPALGNRNELTGGITANNTFTMAAYAEISDLQ